MSEIDLREIGDAGSDDLLSTHAVGGDADREASDADVQAFLELLQGDGQEPTEEQLQKQYDKNFQTLSYLFMKGVFSHAEDEIKRRQ